MKRLLLITLIFVHCSEAATKKETSNQPIEVIQEVVEKPTAAPEVAPITKEEADDRAKFYELIRTIPFRKLPLTDSTSFDSFHAEHFFNSSQIKTLKLKILYPNIDNEKEFESTNGDGKPPYNYHLSKKDFKVAPSYRLNLSSAFKTVVFTVFKGEHELETILVNYEHKGNIIAHKLIAYDESAEGASQVQTKIEKKKLTIFNITWFDERVVEKKVFLVSGDGELLRRL